jgi:hypothetical protein
MDSTEYDADHAIEAEAEAKAGDADTGFEITVVERKDKKSLSKHISKKDGKYHSDISSCKIFDGTAWRMPLKNLGELAAFIDNIGHRAFLLGSLRPGLRDKVDIVVDDKLREGDPARGVISRTQKFIGFEPGKPAVMLLDVDFKGMSDSARQPMDKSGGPVKALELVCPELATVGRVVRKSTSAGLLDSYSGQPLDSGGLHIHVVVRDGSDIGRSVKVLHQRCRLKGFGWAAVTASGTVKIKSLVDDAVGTPERIVFEAHATMDAPYVQDQAARTPETFDGPMLDTHKSILNLTTAELTEWNKLTTADKKSIEPKVREIKEERAKGLVKDHGIDIDTARHIVKRHCENRTLRPQMALNFDDLGACTVAHVLANPDRYINETLADPDDPEDISNRAKVLRGYRDGWPFVKSFAHGGVTYQLRYDAEMIESAMKADPNKAAHVLARLLKHADVDPVELDQLIQQAMKLAEIKTKTAVKELIEQEKGEDEDQADGSREENLDGDPDGDPLWASVYSVIGGCIHFESPSRRMMPMCNFDAYIEETITLDYGDNIKAKIFRISGKTDKGVPLLRIDIPAENLTKMWWIEGWDGKARVEPNYIGRIHHALQKLSSPTECTVYSHLGWRKIDGKWLYLHGGGAVGSDGAVEGIECKPEGRLSECVLIPPRDIKAAMQASLKMLELGSVGSVAFAAIYRAPLGEFLTIDFSLWYSGASGALKSAIVGIMQGHWGKKWTYNHLIENWTTSVLTLEKLAHEAKDSLFTPDDYSPPKTARTQREFQQKADHLMRGAANQQGRGRMKPDTLLRNTFSPRGMIVGSGEDMPPGESLQARIFNVPMKKGDIDFNIIRELDQSVKEGLMAEAMFGYAEWIASRAGTNEEALRSTIVEQHTNLADTSIGGHPRTATNLAHLLIGAVFGMEFAVAVGAISRQDADSKLEVIQADLKKFANEHAEQIADENPVEQFLNNVRTVLFMGAAHISTLDGTAPYGIESITGWEFNRESEKDGLLTKTWRARGSLIGFIHGKKLMLHPKATHAAVSVHAAKQNQIIPSEYMVGRLLREARITTCEEGRSQKQEPIHYTIDKEGRLVPDEKRGSLRVWLMSPVLVLGAGENYPDEDEDETAKMAGYAMP